MHHFILRAEGGLFLGPNGLTSVREDATQFLTTTAALQEAMTFAYKVAKIDFDVDPTQWELVEVWPPLEARERVA